MTTDFHKQRVYEQHTGDNCSSYGYVWENGGMGHAQTLGQIPAVWGREEILWLFL
jgi:hypothetical protein